MKKYVAILMVTVICMAVSGCWAFSNDPTVAMGTEFPTNNMGTHGGGGVDSPALDGLDPFFVSAHSLEALLPMLDYEMDAADAEIEMVHQILLNMPAFDKFQIHQATYTHYTQVVDAHGDSAKAFSLYFHQAMNCASERERCAQSYSGPIKVTVLFEPDGVEPSSYQITNCEQINEKPVIYRGNISGGKSYYIYLASRVYCRISVSDAWSGVDLAVDELLKYFSEFA